MYVRIYIYIYIQIHTHYTHVLSTLVKELTATTNVMQSSSNELCALESESAKCRQSKANTYAS